MHILITKDASTKIPREVADLTEARYFLAQGFHVELLDAEGNTSPLPADDLEPEGQTAEPETAAGGAEDPAPAAKKVAAKTPSKKR